MKQVIRIICILCLFVAVQVVAGMLALFLFNLPNLFAKGIFDINMLKASPSAVGFSVLLTGVIVISVMMQQRWIGYGNFTRNGNKMQVYGYVVLLMLPAIFLINLLSEWLSWEDLNRELFGELMYNPLGVASIILVGPFTEEVVFRMGIQPRFVGMGLSPWWAIALTSLIFGIIHLNPAQIPGAFLFGMILGWLYWRSGTVWVPFSAHVLNNLLGVLLVWLTGNAEQTVMELCGGTWQTFVCALLSMALCLWSCRKLHASFPPLS